MFVLKEMAVISQTPWRAWVEEPHYLARKQAAWAVGIQSECQARIQESVLKQKSKDLQRNVHCPKRQFVIEEMTDQRPCGQLEFSWFKAIARDDHTFMCTTKCLLRRISVSPLDKSFLRPGLDIFRLFFTTQCIVSAQQKWSEQTNF